MCCYFEQICGDTKPSGGLRKIINQFCGVPLGLILVIVGRSSLSLALGNMVVVRQILLVFNSSYLPCSVQFVNKNYYRAKIDLLGPVETIILCVNDVL